MPGTMDDNLRRAYLQEELGVYLLRGLAAVASVPRPQDVGIDAIATLLRRETGRQLVAERSFYVQLKAASVKSVEYSGPALDWLSALKLPVFIGIVNPKASSISLYSCHRAFLALADWKYQALELVPGPAKKDADCWKAESGPSHLCTQANVWLGSPVLVWTPDDMANADFLAMAYSVMSPVLEAEELNLKLRAVKVTARLEWKTNSYAKLTHYGIAAHGFDDLDLLPHPDSAQDFYNATYNRGLPTILNELVPTIKALAAHAINRRQKDDWTVVRGIIEFMRSRGVDPDSEKLFDEYAQRQFKGM